MMERVRSAIVPVVVVVGLGVLIALGWSHHDVNLPPGVGGRMPEYAAPSLRGDTLRIDALRGKVVILNVWATWCPPCRMEMPSLERLYRRLGPRGLEVVAISVDELPGQLGGVEAVRPGVSTFINNMGVTFPVLLDPRGRIEDMFGITGLPTTLVIDRRGMIRDKVIGGRAWDQGDLAERIRQLVED